MLYGDDHDLDYPANATKSVAVWLMTIVCGMLILNTILTILFQ
jgi:hypothetical protein